MEISVKCCQEKSRPRDWIRFLVSYGDLFFSALWLKQIKAQVFV